MVHAEKPSGSPPCWRDPCRHALPRTAPSPRRGMPLLGNSPPSPLVDFFRILQPPLNLPLAPTGERDPGKLSALQMVFFFFSSLRFLQGGMVHLKETGDAYPSQNCGVSSVKRGTGDHPMPSCAMIAQHPDGRVRGTRPESRSNSKLWGRLTAHFSRKESEGDRSNADGRVSITAGTGTTAGFWLVPFPQCPEASLGPFGNTEKPGKRVGRFAVDPGKDGTGSDDDNFRFFLESLRAVGRDGSRSHTHHCWRRRQWCAS